MQIRAIEEADIGAVAQLLQELATQFIVHESVPESAALFLRENDEAALRGFIGGGRHVYYVALVDGALAGFIAMRDKTHLFHLFVARGQQGRGIARALWEHARAASGHPGDFTVNASNSAVGVYEALGFRRTAPMQCVKGLYFNPMALDASMHPLVGAA
jgi:ribosomal protein S18 acetylase RimI-like enzyme